MKRFKQLLSFTLAFLFFLPLITGGGNSQVQAAEDDHLLLRYGQAAEDSHQGWEEYALPLGNGYMGASIFGGIKKERIQLNEKTLWDGGPSSSRPNYQGGNLDKASNGMKMSDLYKLIQQEFLKGNNQRASQLCQYLVGSSEGYGGYRSFGNLYLEFEGEDAAADYERSLDLDTAIARVSYKQAGNPISREYFVNYPSNVLVAVLESQKKGGLSFTLSLQSDQGGQVSSQGKEIKLSGALKDNQLKYAAKLVADPQDGQLEARGGKLVISHASKVYLYYTAGTNYKNEYPHYRLEDGEEPEKSVKKRIDLALEKGFDKLKEEHLEDYQAIFSRVNLHIGQGSSPKFTDQLVRGYGSSNSAEEDRLLESLLFQYGRYLLIASSRPGSLPANLQGVWNDSNNPPWSADYHINVNLQMNYWPAYVTNMSETALPLLDYVESMREPGRVTAEKYMGVKSDSDHPKNGFTANTQNTPFGWTTPGWSFDWGWSPAAVPWILQNVYEYYEYTQDRQALEKIYDILKEEVTLYEQILVYDEKADRMVSAPAYSPEQGPRTMGNTYEQALIWQLYHDTLEASRILGVDADQAEQWEKTFKKLKPIEIGDSGQIKEWYEETTLGSIPHTDRRHRHISHLLGLFPGDLITVDNNEYMEAAKLSLNDRGDEGTGWAIAQKINSWARTGEGNRAFDLVQSQIKHSILPNLWDSHPPYQIDGNFGYTSGIAEMLLQSNAGYINVLPALPDAWKEGSYNGLVARGNFEVSARWTKEGLDTVDILSKSGNKAVVEARGIATARVYDENHQLVESKVLSPSRLAFETEKGKKYHLVGFGGEGRGGRRHPPAR